MLPDPAASARVKDMGKYVALFVSPVHLGTSYQLCGRTITGPFISHRSETYIKRYCCLFHEYQISMFTAGFLLSENSS